MAACRVAMPMTGCSVTSGMRAPRKKTRRPSRSDWKYWSAVRSGMARGLCWLGREDGAHALDDVADVGQERVAQRLGEREWRLGCGHAHGRRFEVEEAAFGDSGGELGAETVDAPGLVGDDEAAGLAHGGFKHGGLERCEAGHVDDLYRDAVARE